MLPDHGRQLKTIEFGHADIHQHHRHIGLKQKFERLLCRSSLDQVLPQSAEHHLIAQQLGRLIIDHKYIDLLVIAHLSFLFSDSRVAQNAYFHGNRLSTIYAATYAKTIATARYSRVWLNIQTLQLPDTSRDPPSWLLR